MLGSPVPSRRVVISSNLELELKSVSDGFNFNFKLEPSIFIFFKNKFCWKYRFIIWKDNCYECFYFSSRLEIKAELFVPISILYSKNQNQNQTTRTNFRSI